MIVDFQAHIFPESYVGAVRRIDGNVIFEPPDPYSGMTYVYDRRLGQRINTATFEGRNPDKRVQHMDELGIDVQVLSIPPPGADRFEEHDAITIACAANDALAAFCRTHPNRFVGLATLPSASTTASIEELNRAIIDLGLRGFGCFSNLNGRPLDSEELLPLWEHIAEL
ncbi:MAG TPA: amidohydrolase family protein, partial [Chloroflexota bacterium]